MLRLQQLQLCKHYPVFCHTYRISVIMVQNTLYIQCMKIWQWSSYGRIVQFFSCETKGQVLSTDTLHCVMTFQVALAQHTVLLYVTHIGECQNSHQSVWYVGTYRTYNPRSIQLQHRYITILFHGIGKYDGFISSRNMDMTNIHDLTYMNVSRQYVSMCLRVFVS
jgi:hypothetical protein